MESDEEWSTSFDNSNSFQNLTTDSMDTSLDLDDLVCGEKNSTFDCLSADDIVNLMNQYIADASAYVDSVVPVR